VAVAVAPPPLINHKWTSGGGGEGEAAAINTDKHTHGERESFNLDALMETDEVSYL